MISSGDALKSLALEAALSPQEEKLEIGRKNRNYLLEYQKKQNFKSNELLWFQNQ